MKDMTDILPTYADMLAAHERIKPYIRRTPVLTSDRLNDLTGAQIFFKCENLQRAGAFKFRGACNAIAALPDNETNYSRELIQDLDADFVFGFYRQQPDATPAAVRAAYETFAPGWCQALTACQNGQFLLLPGPTFGPTMTGLELALELIESNIVARPFTPFEE